MQPFWIGAQLRKRTSVAFLMNFPVIKMLASLAWRLDRSYEDGYIEDGYVQLPFDVHPYRCTRVLLAYAYR